MACTGNGSDVEIELTRLSIAGVACERSYDEVCETDVWHHSLGMQVA